MTVTAHREPGIVEIYAMRGARGHISSRQLRHEPLSYGLVERETFELSAQDATIYCLRF